MATARDVIDRATVLLGVRASGEALEASQAQDCLVELNGLMHEVGANDGAAPPTPWTDIALSDPIAIGAVALADGIVNHMGHALAGRVAPLFGRDIPADLTGKARHAESVLRAAYKASTVVTLDRSLLTMRANYRRGA